MRMLRLGLLHLLMLVGVVLINSPAYGAIALTIIDIAPGYGDLGAKPTNLTVVGERLFFVADDGVHGRELWFSDGTESGTNMVVDLTPGSANTLDEGDGYYFTAVGNQLFFVITGPYDQQQDRLYVSDGTAAGTRLLWQSAIGKPAALGTTAFVPTSEGLLRSDGSVAGTSIILVPDETYKISSVAATTERVFGVSYGTGTPSPTVLWSIKPDGSDLQRYPGFKPYSLRAIGNAMFFSAGVPGSQTVEVYRMDGRTAAAQLLITTQSNSYFEVFPTDNGQFYLTLGGSSLIWLSDGTMAGTRVTLGNFFTYERPVVLGNQLIVPAEEPFLHNGTVNHRLELRDIFPGPVSSSPRHMTRMGDKVYFSATDGQHGEELWVTDGTPAGTQQLRELNPGLSGIEARFARIGELVRLGNRLFFHADDGIHGQELWVSDGTAIGTRLVRNILRDSVAFGSTPSQVVERNGQAYFVATTRAGGREIWRSDGTAAGTTQFTDIGTGPLSGVEGSFLAASDQRFYFSGQATITGSVGLWASDGTLTNTRLVSAPFMSMSNLRSVGEQVFFSGNYGRLWVSDGTLSSTVAVSPALELSLPVATAAGKLYFRGYYLTLWLSDGSLNDFKKIWPPNPPTPRSPLGGPSPVPGLYELTTVGERAFFVDGSYSYWDGLIYGNLYLINDSAESRFLVHEQARQIGELTALNGKLYYRVNDALWVCDGLTGERNLLATLPTTKPLQLLASASQLYIATDSKLYVSDGSAAGTVVIAENIAANLNAGLAVGERVFFPASTAEHGNEPWFSDGTAAATAMLADLRPGPKDSINRDTYTTAVFSTAIGRLFFTADDGVNGQELWSVPLNLPPAVLTPRGYLPLLRR
jgi:ELWxxDGT repeat protein